jgi:hypothetical protein
VKGPLPAVNHCPVCQARFRGSQVCSRCGADLGPLMRLAVKAWHLRQGARQALDAGALERALGLASEAQQVHRTPGGEALRVLIAWLSVRGTAPNVTPPDGIPRSSRLGQSAVADRG